MGKKKKKNKKLKGKAFYSELENKAFFLFKQMGKGLTLYEVASERQIPYSELVEEINAHPRLVQAMKDGKAEGYAFWIKKLKSFMEDKHTNTTAIRLFYANYMDWYTQPTPKEMDENTTVIINVKMRIPTDKELKRINKIKKILQEQVTA